MQIPTIKKFFFCRIIKSFCRYNCDCNTGYEQKPAGGCGDRNECGTWTMIAECAGVTPWCNETETYGTDVSLGDKYIININPIK